MDGNFQENDISRVVEADRAHVWHHLSQHQQYMNDDKAAQVDPRIIVEGKGLRVWDQHGKEHIDAVAGGVWTVNVGYGRESIANAVRDQLVKMNFFGGTMGSIPGALFSEMLIDKMPGMSRVYFASSGSEANEKGFKMVRQIAHKRFGGKKHKILYRDRDYHGTTIATLSAGGQDERNAQYGPYTPGFVRVPHCLEYRKHEQDGAPEEGYGVWAANQIEEIILREGPDTVGALCLEPVTAGGGVITPPEGYWERVREICDQYDVLLHIDEVVCGVGRTGTWFGYQHFLPCDHRESVRHVQGRHVRSLELLPRHIHVWWLHCRSGRSDRKYEHHRARRPVGQLHCHGRLHAGPVARAGRQAQKCWPGARQGSVPGCRTGQRPRQP